MSLRPFALLALAACTGDDTPPDTGSPPGDSGTPPAAEIALLGPGGTPYGHSLGDWGAIWWQWVYQTPGPDSPLFDDTGANCPLGQTGDVFFLAGTTGGVPVTRTCTVPADQALLFPIVNVSSDDSFAAGTASLRTEAEIIAAAEATIASVSDMFLEIDGRAWSHAELLAYVGGPTVFSYTVPPEPNFYSICCGASITGTIDPSVSHGYWALLDPLPPGSHTLRFGGGSNYAGNPNYPANIDVTYELTVQ